MSMCVAFCNICQLYTFSIVTPLKIVFDNGTVSFNAARSKLVKGDHTEVSDLLTC